MHIPYNWKVAPGDLVNLDEIKEQIAANFASKPISDKRKKNMKASPKGAPRIIKKSHDIFLSIFSGGILAQCFHGQVDSRSERSKSKSESISEDRAKRETNMQFRTLMNQLQSTYELTCFIIVIFIKFSSPSMMRPCHVLCARTSQHQNR